MKKVIFLLFYSLSLVLAFTLLSGCGDSSDLGQDEPIKAGVFAKGVPEGSATQQRIGPAGGTIATPDGRISVLVPAGTVGTETLFSIQPINNTASPGSGVAYRLLPENVTFSKPVTIQLKYATADLAGTAAAAMYLAYQTPEGYWKLMGNTELNETDKTLSVQSTHFSDWGIIEEVHVESNKNFVTFNEQALLTVKRILVNQDDLLAPLTDDIVINPEDISWRMVAGAGILQPDNSSSIPRCTFTAPGFVPSPNPVLIETSIRKLPITGKARRTGQVLLVTNIFVRDEINPSNAYMSGTYDGIAFNTPHVTASKIGEHIWIQGVTEAGKSVLLILNANAAGTYSYGTLTEAGKAEIRSNLSGNVFETHYKDPVCPTPPAQSNTKYSSGSVQIKNFPSFGENMEGEFTGTVYEMSNCQLKSKAISGRFSAPKGF